VNFENYASVVIEALEGGDTSTVVAVAAMMIFSVT